MSKTIDELLSSRTDLSTFLVHLTRDDETQTAKQKLESILNQWKLIAGNPLGLAYQKMEKGKLDTSSQKVVSFTETPLQQVRSLFEEIQDRKCIFQPYGIAITKKQGRRLGANPVWYVDQTPGKIGGWLNQEVETLVNTAITNKNTSDPIFKIAPFVESMGTWPQGRKEFWWEREWRCVGNFELPVNLIIFCPEKEMADLEAIALEKTKQTQPAVDPRWSLEMMLAKLARIPLSEAKYT